MRRGHSILDTLKEFILNIQIKNNPFCILRIVINEDCHGPVGGIFHGLAFQTLNNCSYRLSLNWKLIAVAFHRLGNYLLCLLID